MHVPTEDCPSAAENFPGSQSVQADAASLPWYLPAGHSRHRVIVVAPVVVRYLPATQGVQVREVSVKPMAGPQYPALQVQSEPSSLPAGASEFAVHAEHVISAVSPLVIENFPAPQSVHATLPISALYLPAAQRTHSPMLFFV